MEPLRSSGVRPGSPSININTMDHGEIEEAGLGGETARESPVPSSRYQVSLETSPSPAQQGLHHSVSRDEDDSHSELLQPSNNSIQMEELRQVSRETSSSPLSSKAKPRHRLSIWHTWWLEILSTLLAFGSLVAIVTILRVHENEPVPSWPGVISVNSLISIFTSILRASMIMPVAEGM